MEVKGKSIIIGYNYFKGNSIVFLEGFPLSLGGYRRVVKKLYQEEESRI